MTLVRESIPLNNHFNTKNKKPSYCGSSYRGSTRPADRESSHNNAHRRIGERSGVASISQLRARARHSRESLCDRHQTHCFSLIRRPGGGKNPPSDHTFSNANYRWRARDRIPSGSYSITPFDKESERAPFHCLRRGPLE